MTRAVFYGSSTTEGAGTSSPEQRYTTLVCKALGWDEVNLGVGGTTVTGRDETGQIIDEQSGIARVPDVLEAAPDIVLILYGSNDFSNARPLGDPERFQQGTFFWDYDTMLRGLLEGLAPAQIVLSTSQYRSDAETPNALGRTLTDYNGVVTQRGERYGLRVLDAYAESGITARNYASLSSDEIHLNDAGYQRLAAFFIEALRPS